METIKVKIKSWDKMEDEFGLDYFMNINCNEVFVYSMENLLPEDRIIEVTPVEDNNIYSWHVNGNEWNISNDMIEEVIEE